MLTTVKIATVFCRSKKSPGSISSKACQRTKRVFRTRSAPGVLVIDKREPGGYITPIECVGDYATYVSRIRQDSTIDNGINLWVVSDNLRKGAALNAVQIAEVLGNRCLKKG